MALPALGFGENPSQPNSLAVPSIKKGEKQIFVDDVMIRNAEGVARVVHPAKKLDHPALEAETPWEQKVKNGMKDYRLNIYGTVLKDEKDGTLRMWYANSPNVLYAISKDGIHWERPILYIAGKNNRTDLKVHSPSVIYDSFERDPEKRYKAVGSLGEQIDDARLQKLKDKFTIVDWYKDPTRRLYYAAYSGDGLHWTYYPEPILLGCDTVTLAQDPVTGEYLVFHKRINDPRVKPRERQVFLSASKDMENWSEPQPVMVTDEIDTRAAKLLKGGTHSEFYNMSAFPYAGQWLGMVTLFRRVATPGQTAADLDGPDETRKTPDDGPIDVQLVHSRDGRTWSRCSDRTPVIPLGPNAYDAGSISGVCNGPVIVGDEMWMYYSAMTTTHGGVLPDKVKSIGRAAWRIDGMVSLQAKDREGTFETVEFIPEGKNLFVNTDVGRGRLMVEVLDAQGKVIRDYEKESSLIQNQDSTKLAVKWKSAAALPEGAPIRLKFYLENGDLYSYLID